MPNGFGLYNLAFLVFITLQHRTTEDFICLVWHWSKKDLKNVGKKYLDSKWKTNFYKFVNLLLYYCQCTIIFWRGFTSFKSVFTLKCLSLFNYSSSVSLYWDYKPFLRFTHIFSLGLRSGLWLGHIHTVIVSHYCRALASWLRSLSCLKTSRM